MLNLRRHFTSLAPFALAVLLPLSALADDAQPVKSSVPTDKPVAKVEASDLETPPTYNEMGWTVGGEAATNTVGGTSAAAKINLFSFRKASIGRSSQLLGTDQFGREKRSKAYPTHAVELDASFMTGSATSEKSLLVGGEMRARVMIGTTKLGHLEEGCSAYFGGGAEADLSLYSNRSGESRLIANIGPEGGLMCQLGEVMLQVAPTVTLGTTVVGTNSDLSQHIDTGTNLLGLGGRARLLIGDRLYFSADATAHPAITSSDWDSKTGSLNAQLRADNWVFMGTVKRIEMHDSSGTYKDVKGNEGSVSVGRAW